MNMAISSNSQPRPVWAKFVHTEKELLNEFNKQVVLTEDEAEILAHDDSLWNKDAHGNLVKLAAKTRVGEVCSHRKTPRRGQ